MKRERRKETWKETLKEGNETGKKEGFVKALWTQSFFSLYSPRPTLNPGSRMSSGQGKRGLCVAHPHSDHCWRLLKSLPQYWTFEWSFTLPWLGLWAATGHGEQWVWSPSTPVKLFFTKTWVSGTPAVPGRGCSLEKGAEPLLGAGPDILPGEETFQGGDLIGSYKATDFFSTQTLSRLSSFWSFPTQTEFKSEVLKYELFYFIVSNQSCLALCIKFRKAFFLSPFLLCICMLHFRPGNA